MTTSKFDNQPENPPVKKKAGRPRKNVEIIGPTGDSGEDTSRLSDRQRAILRIIIQEFIATAAPVSSEAIVNKYHLPYSPATVRNEMAELEQSGFISHPHTSAGRIPSDLGYRYYVEHLMERRSGLSPVEQNTIQGTALPGRFDTLDKLAGQANQSFPGNEAARSGFGMKGRDDFKPEIAGRVNIAANCRFGPGVVVNDFLAFRGSPHEIGQGR